MAQDDESFIAFEPSEAGSSRAPSRAAKERVNTTLFVSSLPYTATSTDLLTHFSFIGPVRHGFVATDKATGKSKGVGYVTYSMKEDAQRAVDELDGQAFGDGRKIRVSWADDKPSMLDRRNKEPKPAKARPEKPAGPTDPNAIKTLVLSNLPEEITKAVLWKKVRKVDDSIELVYPVEGQSATAHLIMASHNDAVKAAPKLHGHTYKGNLLSCVLKKRLERLGAGAGGNDKGASHAGRLIVRNLPWDTTEADLRATFLPFGALHSVDLPTAPSKYGETSNSRPRLRGFAFVWFLSKKDAEKALETINGKPLSRAPSAGKAQKAQEQKKDDRPVAVDWALSKEKYEEAKRAAGGAVEGVKKAEEGSDEDESDEEDEEDGSDEDDRGEGEEESDEESGEEDEDEDDEDEEDEEGEEPVKPKLPSVDVGSTLFIRNLPFEVDEQELNTLFRSFGPLRYARITVDHATGRSRGSGFVCFWKKEHADAAIAEAEKVVAETGANAMPLGGGSNPFALPSVLTADPSSSLASRLVLHGRTLEVSRAVTREQASQMKEDGERARHAGDKRNTYLMREGVIFPNSPAAGSLPAAELEKRQQAFNARKALLRSNPSLYISKTRLSVRQLPLFATDRTLKRLAIHAVRTFDEEVKAGTREPLSRAEETDETASAVTKSKKRGERPTAVIQSKVVRSDEKTDPITSLGRSKGYGFLEIRTHQEALKVLRWANNNPEVGPLMYSWWKIEMEELATRLKKEIEKAGGASATPAASDDAEETPATGGRETKEDKERRVRMIEQRLSDKGDGQREGGMRGGKTLLIEFSIENIQVVRRRSEKMSTTRGPSAPGAGGRGGQDGKRYIKPAEDSDDDAQASAAAGNKRKGGRNGGRSGGDRKHKPSSDARPGKGDNKRKRAGGDEESRSASAAPAEREKRGLEKMGDKLGSLIGRKRKMRRTGK